MRLRSRSPISPIEQERRTQIEAEESKLYHSKKLGSWIPPERWDSSAKRNYSCEICGELVSYSDSLDSKCSICNVVVHISCLTVDQRNHRFRNGWVCDDCLVDIQESKELFVVLKTQKNYEEAAVLAQVTISKTWRKYRHVKFYKYTLMNVLRLQELARKIKRKNLITEFRQNMLRPGGVTVVKALDLAVSESGTQSCDPYVIISVVDIGEPKSQHWMFQTRVQETTLDPEFNEEFLIPGITGKQGIVFTVIDRDELRDQFMGQAILMLQHKRVWSRGGSFLLPLHPIEYFIQRSGASISLDLSTVKPTGCIEVKYTPMTRMDQTCGYLFGPSVDNILAARQGNLRSEDVATQKEIQTKKIWVVVANGKLFLHKRFGEICKVIIELSKTEFQINEKYECLVFDFFLSGLPKLTFTAPDLQEGLRWKITLLSAWQMAKTSRFQLHTLVAELTKLRELKVPPQDQSEEQLVVRKKTMVRTKSQLPLLGRKKSSKRGTSNEENSFNNKQILYPTYRKLHMQQSLPLIKPSTPDLEEPKDGTFRLKAKLLSPREEKITSNNFRRSKAKS